MPWKWITPDEAPAVAAKFRRAAHRVRELSSELREVQRDIDATWEGRSKDNFARDFSPFPTQVDDLAEQLESSARKIESMKVRVWVRPRDSGGGGSW